MFFSRAVLRRDVTDLGSLGRFVSDQYRVHQQVWKLFPGTPEQTRDFLYRRRDQDSWPAFYIVSRREPTDTLGVWDLESKPYRPAIVVGQTLAFDVRVNPVRTRKGADGKGRRHDVVMDAKSRLTEGERTTLATLVQEEGTAWLQSRAEKNGFAIAPGSVRAEGYQQHRLYKKGGTVQYSTLDLSGVLRVSDADRFTDLLMHGLGPAKGFGCGLMMVRRV